MRVTNISWDTDNVIVDLPTELDVPVDKVKEISECVDEVSEWLSNTYGWLVKSFILEVEEDD